jgi:hypothetical protein
LAVIPVDYTSGKEMAPFPQPLNTVVHSVQL